MVHLLDTHYISHEKPRFPISWYGGSVGALEGILIEKPVHISELRIKGGSLSPTPPMSQDPEDRNEYYMCQLVNKYLSPNIYGCLARYGKVIGGGYKALSVLLSKGGAGDDIIGLIIPHEGKLVTVKGQFPYEIIDIVTTKPLVINSSPLEPQGILTGGELNNDLSQKLDPVSHAESIQDKYLISNNYLEGGTGIQLSSLKAMYGSLGIKNNPVQFRDNKRYVCKNITVDKGYYYEEHYSTRFENGTIWFKFTERIEKEKKSPHFEKKYSNYSAPVDASDAWWQK